MEEIYLYFGKIHFFQFGQILGKNWKYVDKPGTSWHNGTNGRRLRPLIFQSCLPDRINHCDHFENDDKQQTHKNSTNKQSLKASLPENINHGDHLGNNDGNNGGHLTSQCQLICLKT